VAFPELRSQATWWKLSFFRICLCSKCWTKEETHILRSELLWWKNLETSGPAFLQNEIRYNLDVMKLLKNIERFSTNTTKKTHFLLQTRRTQHLLQASTHSRPYENLSDAEVLKRIKEEQDRVSWLQYALIFLWSVTETWRKSRIAGKIMGNRNLYCNFTTER